MVFITFNFVDKNYIQGIITIINSNIQEINSRISNLVSEDSKTNSRIDKNINTIQELSSKINKLNSSLNSLQIPTKVSQLNNDSGFITKNYVDSVLGDINSKLDLINGEVI